MREMKGQQKSEAGSIPSSGSMAGYIFTDLRGLKDILGVFETEFLVSLVITLEFCLSRTNCGDVSDN